MSDEIKNEEIKNDEKVCKCERDLFKKFSLITAGAFTGCLLALCVFTTFAKPPMPAPAPMPAPVQWQRPMPPMHGEYGRPEHHRHHQKFERRDHRRGDFHKKDFRNDTPRPQKDQQKPSR